MDNKQTKGITMYSTIYGASESMIGINLWPKFPVPEYLLIPTWNFYEFIPVEDSDLDSPRVLTSRQVRVGGTYIILITTATGLYRYKLGDVVKVVRLFHQAPVIEFLYREKFIMNIGGESISEDVMYNSLLTAASRLKIKLVDYTCANSSLLTVAGGEETVAVPFYVLFLEILGDVSLDKLTEQIDECMQTRCSDYRHSRMANVLDHPKVVLVERGAFLEFNDYLVKVQKANQLQFKMPRCISDVDKATFLLERQVNSNDDKA
jgi:hypothetical protein